MSSDCGTCIAKYILCIFNFIFFIAGSILLGIGIWLAADKVSFIALLKMVESEHIDQFSQPAVIEQMAYVMIGCGAVMFILSFLGYCGAIRESTCMLTTYAVFLIIILVIQITVAGLAAAYKERARNETKTFLQSTITRYYSSAERIDAVTLMWNNLMEQMSCCGIDDYRDFNKSEKWLQNKGNRTLPESCCILQPNNLREYGINKLKDPNCPYQHPSRDTSYYLQGCYDKLIDLIMSHRNIVIGVGVGIGLIQLLAIFLAFCLCRSIDRYRVIRL